MILNARVKEVQADKVIYTTKDPKTGEMSEHEVDSGFTLWSTGIGSSAMCDFTCFFRRRAHDTSRLISDEPVHEACRIPPPEPIPQARARGRLSPASARRSSRYCVRPGRLRDD